MEKLVIFGISDAAELAHYYFSRDSDYEVEAFTVDSSYLPESGSFCGLPVVPFEEVTNHYPPSQYVFFVALGYSNLNQTRIDKYLASKVLGYKIISYVSSKATVLNDGQIGENCFILENNTIQPFVTIGNNVTLWSGNHIGHHSTIGNHCFLASHIVVSGRVQINEACFIGVNVTLRDHIVVGDRCILGAGTLIMANVEAGGVYVQKGSSRSQVPSMAIKKI